MSLKANKSSLVLLSALAVGAILMFATVSKASIWHDEGYTLMLAPQDPGQILMRTARDVHPPLYYLGLHYWMGIFGTSELGARSLSAVFMLGIVVIGFLLVRRLFGDRPAQLSAVFLATAPFLIRYGQEARMYAMVAFLLLLATYWLVIALEKRQWIWWILYGLVLAASMYTHYYSIFIVAVHWGYVLYRTKLKLPQWWAANVLAGLVFLPWVPAAYGQFTRVQAAFWIPKVTPLTIPGTIGQFFTFTDLGAFPPALRIAGTLILGSMIVWALRRYKNQRTGLGLLAAYAFAAPVLVWLLSFGRPIYVDRYFVFAAVGFYCLLAVLLTLPWLKSKLQTILVTATLAVFGVGITNVYAQSDHQMRLIGHRINQDFEPGDDIVSGELYTYFDFSYYNRTDYTPKLLAPMGVTGYGETSLLYDRADQIVIRDYSELKPASGRIWVVGKTGQHDYFDKVPSNWEFAKRVEAGYVATQLYLVK